MGLQRLISSESGGISPEFHLSKVVAGGDGVGKGLHVCSEVT